MRRGTALAILMCTATIGLAAPAHATPGQMEFGGLTRTYTVHVPPGRERPTGLVINLHAAGATGPQQAALTHYDAVADAHGFVVAYPDGIDFSWADGRGASVPDRQGVDDVGFISALTSTLIAEHRIDPGRVYVTGLSAGAFMANRLACDRADLFVAVAPVAGTLGDGVPCNPSRPVSVLAMHGTSDPIVPFDGGPMVGRGGPSTILSAPALVERWRQVDGCGMTAETTLPGAGPQVRRISSACNQGTVVTFLRIDGGGHTWPGAPTVLSEEQVGSTARSFDASETSWQFFTAHWR